MRHYGPHLQSKSLWLGLAVLEVQAANTNDDSLFGEAFDGSVGEKPSGTVCVSKAACKAITSSDFHMPILQAHNRVKCPYYR